MNRHEVIDQRSLAFGRMIAAKLQDNPALIEHARRNLEKWLKTCSPGVRSTLLEWNEVLNSGLEPTLRLLTQWNERAIRLRQSSPFAGLLTQSERNEIIRRFKANDTAAT